MSTIVYTSLLISAVAIIVSAISLIAVVALMRRTKVLASLVEGLVKTGRLKLGKPRRRYIAVMIVGEASDKSSLEDAIREKVMELAGAVGLSMASPMVVEYNNEIGYAIIRTNHQCLDLVLAAIGLTRNVKGRDVLMVPLRVSGTVKGARRAVKIRVK